MKILIALIAIFLTGCTSLKSRVFNDIKVGDDKEHVRAVLGEPDQWGPSQKVEGAMAWYYKSGREICGFTISQDDKVLFSMCTEDPNHRSGFQKTMGVVGTAMQGMGDGLKRSSKRIDCQSTTLGKSTDTTCY